MFDELSKSTPLFCQVEIKHIKNYKWNENGKEYVGEVEIIGFFDLNKEKIKEKMNIIKKEEVIKQQYYRPPPSSKCYVYNTRRDDDGKIEYQVSEGTKENYKYLQVIEGAIKGGFIGGALGTTVTFDTKIPAAPIVLIRGVIGLGIGSYFSLFSEEEKKEEK